MRKNPLRLFRYLTGMFLLYITCGLFSFSYNHRDEKPDLTGFWFTEKNEGLIEVTEKNGLLYGKLVRLKEPYRDGLPKKDAKNKDLNLRERPMIGIHIIYDLKYNPKDNIWEKGWIYIPKLGYAANCIIIPVNKNTIRVKGFMGTKVVGHTQTWTRKDF